MSGSGNIIAYLALFGYPLVAVALFRRMPVANALIWTILLGTLFLPQGFRIDIPLLPDPDKNTVPALAALVLVMIHGQKEARRLARSSVRVAGSVRETATTAFGKLQGRRRHPVIVGLMVVFILSPLAIAFTNTDPIPAGPYFVPGMSLFDGLSQMQSAILTLVPFFMARRYLGSPDKQITLLRIFVALALVYSILMLWEVRFSPQLHRLIYGYHQHSFAQHIRNGYRPMVFMYHGLAVGLFCCMSILAATALWRISRDLLHASKMRTGRRMQAGATVPAAPQPAPKGRRGAGQARDPMRNPVRWAVTIVWLIFILMISRNLGATAIALMLLPVILFTPTRVQLLVAAVLGMTIMAYPVLRSSGLAPTETVVGWAASIDANRADSLEYRLRHEDMLMEKASERPLLGWGSWGRNRVRDETGQDISVTDGLWVSVLGISGWVGYLSYFGLLSLPIVMLARRGRSDIDPAAAALSLMLAATLIDAIPNNNVTPITWLIAGSLAGRVEMTAKSRGPVRRPAAAFGADPPRRAMA